MTAIIFVARQTWDTPAGSLVRQFDTGGRESGPGRECAPLPTLTAVIQSIRQIPGPPRASPVAWATVPEFDPNSPKRIARVSLLLKELTEKYELNTEQSRARCIKIAGDIAGLLDAEDRYQRRLSSPLTAGSSTPDSEGNVTE